MKQSHLNQLFAGVQLPIKPAMAADGAQLAVLEEPGAVMPGQMPFFGGFAEDLLADFGLDVAAEAPTPAKAKQV